MTHVDIDGTAQVSEKPQFHIDTVARFDMTGDQFKTVKVVGWDPVRNGPVVEVCNIAGEKMLGLLQNAPKIQGTAQVMTEGKSKARLGAAANFRDSWCTDANGMVVPMQTPTATLPFEWVGGRFLGTYALSTTPTNCELATVLVGCNNPWVNYYGEGQ